MLPTVVSNEPPLYYEPDLPRNPRNSPVTPTPTQTRTQTQTQTQNQTHPIRPKYPEDVDLSFLYSEPTPVVKSPEEPKQSRPRTREEEYQRAREAVAQYRRDNPQRRLSMIPESPRFNTHDNTGNLVDGPVQPPPGAQGEELRIRTEMRMNRF